MAHPLVEKQFFHSLGGIRGVAAILVMLYHVPFLIPADLRGAYLSVDLFFVLSGVVICSAYEKRLYGGLSFQKFAWMRLIRLYPLYLLGGVLGVIGVLIQGPLERDALLVKIPLALLFLPDLRDDNTLYAFNNPAWSLFFEILVNLLYALCFRILSVRVLLAIMLASAAGLFYLLFGESARHLNIGWSAAGLPGGLLRVAYSFFAGALLYRLFQRARPSSWLVRHGRPVLLLALPLIAAVLYLLVKNVATRPYSHLFIITVVFPALTYAALWYQPKGVAGAVMEFLGVLSYPIYMLHLPLSTLFLELYPRWTGRAVQIGGAGWVFITLFLALCWALHHYYDEPVRQRLLRLRYFRSGARATGLPATK